MSEKSSAHSGPRPITLRRDKKGALKFNGERIGAATRHQDEQDDNEEWRSYEISARLFKTTGGKYVVGVEVYNRTDEHYEARDGIAEESLESLASRIKGRSTHFEWSAFRWLDDDILGELFESTEIADQFVEQID
jgi:hypothetical protein